MGIAPDGIRAATSSGDSPVDSRPTIIALDLRQSTSRCTAEPDESAAIVLIFRERHQSTAAANDGPLQLASENAEPMAPRRPLGGKRIGGIRGRNESRSRPPLSAVRTIAPTFTGLLIS